MFRTESQLPEGLTIPSRFAGLGLKIRAGLGSAFGRFPWMLLCGFLGTTAAIMVTKLEGNHADLSGLWERIGMTAALGMPLFFSLRMVREQAASLTRWPVEVAGLALLVPWFFTLPKRPFEGPEIVGIHWALLLAALHFFAAVSPYVAGRAGNGFWQFNRKIFLRFSLATLYAWVLTVGLELALLSADKLFELKLEKSYGYLYFIMAGCFHPLFFLAGAPRDFAALEADEEHPRGLKAFTQFALAPLVAVYTAILYAYALKIALAKTWPHGWVALPVLILSGVGILSALLLFPLRSRGEEKWARWYCRNFPRALAPLSLLLLLSVRERIVAYGVTEERHLGIVAGGWIMVWALASIFRRSAGIRWVPASLAVICALAAYGPLSAGAISLRSQTRRLTRALEARGLLVAGKVRPAEKTLLLPDKEREEISSEIGYIAGMHGEQEVRRIFGDMQRPAEAARLTRWNAPGEILRNLGVEGPPDDGGSAVYHFTLNQGDGLTFEGFSHAFIVENLYENSWQGKTDGRQPRIGLHGGKLELSRASDTVTHQVPTEALLEGLTKRQGGGAVPVEQMTIDDTYDGKGCRLVFTVLNFSTRSGHPAQISSCSGLLLVK